MKNQRESQKLEGTRWTVHRSYLFQFSCEEAVARLIKIHMETEEDRIHDRQKNEISLT